MQNVWYIAKLNNDQDFSSCWYLCTLQVGTVSQVLCRAGQHISNLLRSEEQSLRMSRISPQDPISRWVDWGTEYALHTCLDPSGYDPFSIGFFKLNLIPLQCNCIVLVIFIFCQTLFLIFLRSYTRAWTRWYDPFYIGFFIFNTWTLWLHCYFYFSIKPFFGIV